MKTQLELSLSPEQAFSENLRQEVAKVVGLSPSQQDWDFRILRRSIDARKPNIKVNLRLEVYQQEEKPALLSYQKDLPSVATAAPVLVVGFGPAGMFAALRLIELGYKPIVLERGQDVRARRRDLAAINKQHLVNEESNYCFGEGGAGTYSDGKLYTRSKKRGNIRRILEIFVAHGAKEEILYEAHPHIGTNKLPKIVANIRESILQAGGEIHFNTKVQDFIIKNQKLRGVITVQGDKIEALGVILATGHSARDIFHLLHRQNILIEFKPFALGVRVEHAQQVIDQIQYKCKTDRGEYLPPSAYSLVAQVPEKAAQTRGVFSFCMCPGGFIVPSATAPGEVVVNGMSPSRRNSRYANSGIVVGIAESDLTDYQQYGALAGLYFQQAIEQQACQLAGNRQTAPAQRLLDFVQGKVSSSLLETSYQPGLHSLDMREVLPDFVARSLRMGFKQFGKKMKGYLSNDAQIVGVESRTSSPVRIPRDKITGEHPQIAGLFPCGEGGGFAGGIMSAALDGEYTAERLVAQLKPQS